MTLSGVKALTFDVFGTVVDYIRGYRFEIRQKRGQNPDEH